MVLYQSKLDHAFTKLALQHVFEAHNSAIMILYRKTDFYIISNEADYDGHQYHASISPVYDANSTPEGQDFGHCLVISTERVSNVADPDAIANDCPFFWSMKQHFVSFWEMVRSNFDD